MMIEAQLPSVHTLLACATPPAWLEAALANLPLLMVDHAHCEKKAAASALSLIHHYPHYPDLLQKMSRLAREELRHFEQVCRMLNQRQIPFCHLSPARYATNLRQWIRHSEPQRLFDSLIIGAFIEARSCERFACLAPHLDQELSDFYYGLLASEARHFQDYLHLAIQVQNIDEMNRRCAFFAKKEAELILSPDTQLRFHSGLPTRCTSEENDKKA